MTGLFLTNLAELNPFDINAKSEMSYPNVLCDALHCERFYLAALLMEKGANAEVALSSFISKENQNAASWLLARGIPYECDLKDLKLKAAKKPVSKCTVMLHAFALANEELKTHQEKFAKMLGDLKHLPDEKKLESFMKHKPGIKGNFFKHGSGVKFLKFLNENKSKYDMKEIFCQTIQQELLKPKPDLYLLCKLRFWQNHVLQAPALRVELQASSEVKDVVKQTQTDRKI